MSWDDIEDGNSKDEGLDEDDDEEDDDEEEEDDDEDDEDDDDDDDDESGETRGDVGGFSVQAMLRWMSIRRLPWLRRSKAATMQWQRTAMLFHSGRLVCRDWVRACRQKTSEGCSCAAGTCDRQSAGGPQK